MNVSAIHISKEAALRKCIGQQEIGENAIVRLQVPYYNGKREGLYQSFYQNGKPKVEVLYKNDKKEGLQKNYDENGKISRETTYENGKRIGITKIYYKGSLTEEIPYKNGKIDGPVKRYKNGKVGSEFLIQNDEKEAIVKQYYKNGKLAVETPYIIKIEHIEQDLDETETSGYLKHDAFRFIRVTRDGTARLYDTQGKLALEISYKNDIAKYPPCSNEVRQYFKDFVSNLHDENSFLLNSYVIGDIISGSNDYDICKDIDNNESSKPSQEAQLVNNELEGIVKEYDFNGNVSKETPYKNGKKDGVEKEYYESGKLSNIARYVNDERIETRRYYENGNLGIETIDQDGITLNKLYKENGELYLETIYDSQGNLKTATCKNNRKLTQEDVNTIEIVQGMMDMFQYLQNTCEKTCQNKDDRQKGCVEREYGEIGYGDKVGLIMEVPYKNGKKDGLEIEYRENSITPYKNGKKEGIARTDQTAYTVFGYSQYYSETPYKNDKKDGLEIIHDSNGLEGGYNSETPYKNGKIHGIERSSHSRKDDSWLNYETPYKDGKKHGIQKEYHAYLPEPDITFLIRETPYVDDKKHGIEKEYYEENGKIRSEVEYKNDKAEGTEKIYHKNGKLAYSATYKDDKKHGIEKWYYDDGVLLLEGVYANGEKNGIEKTYYRNGKLSSQANYENGERVGITKTYYSNGNLLSEREYKNDGIEAKYYDKKGQLGLEVIFEKQKEYMQRFYEVKSATCKNGKVLTKDEQDDIARISNIFANSLAIVKGAKTDVAEILGNISNSMTSQEVWYNRYNRTIYDKYPDVCGE